MPDYRKEMKDIEKRILLWKTRGPVEAREYVLGHQKRLKEIENGNTPFHGEIDDRRSAIKWCQERVLNPALRIKELEDELQCYYNVLQLRREREAYWLKQMEAAKVIRDKAEQSARDVEQWMREQYPGIAFKTTLGGGR